MSSSVATTMSLAPPQVCQSPVEMLGCAPPMRTVGHYDKYVQIAVAMHLPPCGGAKQYDPKRMDRLNHFPHKSVEYLALWMCRLHGTGSNEPP